MPTPTLSDLTAFLAICVHRSFRKAADELGVSPSRLSHAMRSLEGRLGVRLLNRSTRSVAPTEAGLRLADQLRPALLAVDHALKDVGDFGLQPNGTVRSARARPPRGSSSRPSCPNSGGIIPTLPWSWSRKVRWSIS